MVVELVLPASILKNSDGGRFTSVARSDASSPAPFPLWVEDTSWFHSGHWQDMMAESLQDLKEGRYETFDSLEDFLDSLPDE